MNADRILAMLSGVKQTGSGRYLAKCPAHEDRSPSLSVRELEDGRVLIHCFGGCGTDAVLGALNLTLADLFPEKVGQHYEPSKSRMPAADILQALAHEIDVAAIITARIVDKHEVDATDWQRLALAAQRIGAATHAR